MPSKLSVNVFLSCLRQSGLVHRDRFGSLLLDLNKRGIDIRDPDAIAAALVDDQTLSPWQAEKLLEGKRRGFVLGKYRLLALLGRGGMNAVYLAEHSLMRRRCAIKVLPTKNQGDSEYLARFHQEARSVALLDHTNIVRAYDVDKGLDGRTEIHFFVMEFVEGENLDERVTRTGPLSPIDAAAFIRQAAVGLAHAHRSSIVHRDIKPANLLIDRDGVVKILDLGLASFFNERPSKSAGGDGNVVGTTDFLPPEQALNQPNVDGRADIYSLGCTLYFLLAGHPPFPGGTWTERLVRHQFEQPKPITELRPDVPADLAAIMNKMLAKKPADRFPSAEKTAEALRQWLVQHADRDWIRKNPGVLSGGGPARRPAPPRQAVPQSTAGAVSPTLIPAATSQRAPLDPAIFSPADSEALSGSRDELLRRLGLFETRQNALQVAWSKWRRELLIAGATLCVVLLLVVGIQWLVRPSSAHSTAAPGSTPSSDRRPEPSPDADQTGSQ